MSFRLVNKIEEANAITHDGVFHADEVFATALLEMIKGEVNLLRTRKVAADDKPFDVIMYDVGGRYSGYDNVFDHHQRDFEISRSEDGIKLSSFGLLWYTFGTPLLSDKYNCPIRYSWQAHKDIDSRLVKWIDARDNGQLGASEELTVSGIISGFNPNWNEDDADSDACFIKAVNFAYMVLNNLIKAVVSEYKAIDIVEERIRKSNTRVLNLKKYVNHWQAIVLKSTNPIANELLYCTYIGSNEDVCIVAIPPDLKEMTKQRKPFPEEWAGLSGTKLEEVTGIKGVRFCHAERFFMSVDSERVAAKVLKKIL